MALPMSTVTDEFHAAIPRPVRRYAVCSPDHFAIGEEINPWMCRSNQPSHDCVQDQWSGLMRTLATLGATVDVIPAVPDLTDMVFTRDSAIVLNGRAIKGRFQHRSRRPEADHVMTWLGSVGCAPADFAMPAHAILEGGDVAVFGGRLLIGFGYRSNRAAHAALSDGLGVTVHSLRLIDPRFYHLDTCFCPLDERHALIAAHAFDRASRRLLWELVPEPLELRIEESLHLCANAVVLGRTVVMPHCPPRLATLLHDHGFEVRVVPVEEFKKSGGAVSCLTLPLDRCV